MMIEISEQDFSRLKQLAEPLVDTSATVITRLLDFYEEHHGFVEIEKTPTTDLAPSDRDIPPLRHTKILMARFDGKEPDRRTWDGLLRLALSEGWKKAQDFEELKAVSGANIFNGRKDDQGYKYLPELKISYQGVSADDAVKIIQRLTFFLSTECKFDFEWRNKEGAFLPGQSAHGHIGKHPLRISRNTPHADT